MLHCLWMEETPRSQVLPLVRMHGVQLLAIRRAEDSTQASLALKGSPWQETLHEPCKQLPLLPSSDPKPRSGSRALLVHVQKHDWKSGCLLTFEKTPSEVQKVVRHDVCTVRRSKGRLAEDCDSLHCDARCSKVAVMVSVQSRARL